MAVQSIEGAHYPESRQAQMLRASRFRPVGDNFLFRAPNPRIFGHARHFIVTAEQSAAIIERLAVPSRLGTMIGWGTLALVFLALATALVGLYSERFPVLEMVVIAMAILLLPLIPLVLLAVHHLAVRQLQTVEPILAGAAASNDRISNGDVLWAMRTSGGANATRRNWIVSAVLSGILAISFCVFGWIVWPHHGGAFAHAQSIYNFMVAGMSAIRVALYLRRAVQCATNQATRTTDRWLQRAFWAATGLFVLLVIGHAVLIRTGVVGLDYAALRDRYESQAANGDIDATNRLAWLYRDGKGGARNDIKSRELYERAASQGDASAMFWVGWFYEHGRGVTVDLVQAKGWYEKSAASGNNFAENSLGWFYLNGLSVTKDYGTARMWFERSAAHGNSAGMANLGSMYQFGWGVPRDYSIAKSWFEKAAAAGNGSAMNNLGSLYSSGGPGIDKDLAAARTWFERSADAGNRDGIGNLSVSLINAQAGAIDLGRAARLLLQSAKLDAQSRRQELLGPMPNWPPAARAQLKSELARLGYYHGAIDGEWNSDARAAVQDYLSGHE